MPYLRSGIKWEDQVASLKVQENLLWEQQHPLDTEVLGCSLREEGWQDAGSRPQTALRCTGWEMAPCCFRSDLDKPETHHGQEWDIALPCFPASVG